MRRAFVVVVAVLAGTGPPAAFDPQFQFGTIAAGHKIRAIVTADFNGDGHLDFATADYTSPSEVSIFLGAGDGTFTLNGRVTVPAGAFGIASADFNHDGRKDLVVTSADSNSVSILKWSSTH